MAYVDEHPLLFPNILRQSNATQIRVPIDDTHTRVFFVRFNPQPGWTGHRRRKKICRWNTSSPTRTRRTRSIRLPFRMDAVQAQDHMAWETQGPIADRTRERLTTSDRGIVMLREMMKREIKKVKARPRSDGRHARSRPCDDRFEARRVTRGPEYRRELREMAA